MSRVWPLCTFEKDRRENTLILINASSQSCSLDVLFAARVQHRVRQQNLKILQGRSRELTCALATKRKTREYIRKCSKSKIFYACPLWAGIGRVYPVHTPRFSREPFLSEQTPLSVSSLSSPPVGVSVCETAVHSTLLAVNFSVARTRGPACVGSLPGDRARQTVKHLLALSRVREVRGRTNNEGNQKARVLVAVPLVTTGFRPLPPSA